MRLTSRSTVQSLPHPPAMPALCNKDIYFVLALAAAWILMAALVNPVGNFPLNDDWVYARAVQSVLETGEYRFLSETSSNVGPQIYWGALFCLPFGFSFTALRFSALVLGFVGILVLYWLVLDSTHNRKIATIGSLCLAVNPIYFSLSNTFMTDVPFLVVTLISSYTLVRGLSRESRSLITIGIVIAFVAILIRQLGIIILVAYAAAVFAKRGFSSRAVVSGTSLVIAGLAIHLGYQYLMVKYGRAPALTAHANSTILSFNFEKFLKTFVIGFLYSGVFIAPFVAVFAGLDRYRRPARLTVDHSFLIRLAYTCIVVALFLVIFYFDKLLPAKGNILIASGIGPLTLLDTYILGKNLPDIPTIGKVLWAVSTLIAVASIVYAAHLLIGTYNRQDKRESKVKMTSNNRSWKLVYFATVGSSYFAILALISGKVTIFDRYFIIFLPVLILILINALPLAELVQTRIGMATSVSLTLALTVFSVLATHDYLSFNRTRWMALDDLMKQGVSPENIDGGYEFNGTYTYDPRYRRQPDKSWWWVVDDKYVIASGLLPNYSELRRYSFQRWLLGTQSAIVVLRRSE